MSEQQKPVPHAMIHIGRERIQFVGPGHPLDLTPDEAVVLGYALVAHGLYLKGRMK